MSWSRRPRRSGTRSTTPFALAGAGAVALVVCGCAPAVPLLSGGSTTPHRRGDAVLGGAVRVPVGEPSIPRSREADRSRFGRSAGAGGVVPLGLVRYGVAEHWDVGAAVAGTTARLEVRRELVLEEDLTRPVVLLGAGLIGGWVDDRGRAQGDDNGWRLGGETHALYAVEFGGIYDLWVGARAGAEHVRGGFAPDDRSGPTSLHATAVRAGPVLGVALGFRRVHALLELSGYYEKWLGESVGGGLRKDGGFVLVPAFALRIRI